MRASRPQTFTVVWERVAFSGVIATFALIGISMVAYGKPGDRVPGIVFTLISIPLLYRSSRCATVLVDVRRVTLRSAGRTRHFALQEIERAGDNVGVIGYSNAKRQYLMLTLINGRTIRFTELNNKPPFESHDHTLVVRCATAINDAVDDLKRDVPSAP